VCDLLANEQRSQIRLEQIEIKSDRLELRPLKDDI
jgi:hypothetical protein